MGARVIAVWVVLALAFAGPLPPLAMAQPAGQTTEPAQPQPTPPEAQPTLPEAQTTPPEAQPTPPEAQPTPPQAQPTPPPEPTPPAAQGQQPEVSKEAVKAEDVPPAERRKTDVYDVGAGAMTVLGMPLKAATCALGAGVAVALFAITFGTADRASASVVREGCVQRWIVRGSDIRPDRTSHDGMRAWDDHDGAAR